MAHLWVWLASVGVAHGTTASSSLILERSYWEDRSATALFSDAQSQSYTPFVGHFNGGYSPSAHWIRLKIDASNTPIGLRMTPAWVDEITLYDSAHPDAPQRGGDLHPAGSTVAPTLGYSFVLPASTESRYIWLQLRSTSTHQLHFETMPADQLHIAEKRAIVWTSLYTAGQFFILLALLGAWLVERDTVLGAYLLRHSVYMVYAISYLGLPLMLLNGLVPERTFHTIFGLTITSLLPIGLWFDITFLKTYQPHLVLLRATQSLCVLSLAFPILWLLGYERNTLHATVICFIPAILLLFATAISTRPTRKVERLMSKRIMLLYYTIILSSLIIGLTGLLGINQPEWWSKYLLILHGLVSGLVMTMILIVRAQRQYRQNQQMSWELQKSQQEVVLEQRRRQEQSQFLHMLMHELKIPLSIVSLALGDRNQREENLQHAGHAVQDMKAIIDRCLQADQLGLLTLQLRMEALDLQEVLNHLVLKIPALASRLRLALPVQLPRLQSDRQLLEIVLVNLLDNAGKYSDPVTSVTVHAEPSQRAGREGIEVRVSNTPGQAGWPDPERLFEKYYRSSGAQSKSGSGLGLFLSRDLAQSLGGALDYVPSDHFVEFVLWIPLAPN